MTELLTAALAFPTVVYTILLVVVVIYWLFVVIGALDIDMLDGGDGMLEGGTEGAAEGAADGMADGMADGLADGAADGMADGMADGAADGMADGMADGAADGAGDVEVHTGGGVLATLLGALKLRSAPVTVVFSSIVLIGWALSILGMYYLGGALPDLALKPIIGVGAFLVALPLTSIAIRPLAPVFVAHHARTRADVIGHTATVTTGRVDERFGNADCVVGGDHLLIEVRARADKGIKRGAQVLVIDYDREREAYLVEPMD